MPDARWFLLTVVCISCVASHQDTSGKAVSSFPFKKAALCCERRPYTLPSGFTSPRSFSSLLGTGNLAAHTAYRLMLLDPSPDMVHGSALREDPFVNTRKQNSIRRRSALRMGIHPCCSGLQVQGSAISPAGMAYFHSRSTAMSPTITHFLHFCKRYLKDSRKFHKWVNMFIFVKGYAQG